MEKFLYRQIPYSLHGLNSPDLFYAEDKHKVNMDYVDTRIPWGRWLNLKAEKIHLISREKERERERDVKQWNIP